MGNLTFTLGDIRRRRPCGTGWERLLTGLGVGAGYDPHMRVSLGDVAATNDAVDALWCARCLDWSDVAVRRAVISGAVLPSVKRAAAYTTDQQVHDCIAALDRWCDGDDAVDPMAVARAAWAARAARVARAAARVAEAAEAAWDAAAAAWAAEAAAAARDAAAAAEAARWAARAAEAAEAAEAAADDAWTTERQQQRRDIIAAFPPLVVKEV